MKFDEEEAVTLEELENWDKIYEEEEKEPQEEENPYDPKFFSLKQAYNFLQ